MVVYRISKLKYANDLSGKGAKLFGGRWNLPGYAMLYTSSHISLAFLEMLVNANRRQLKSNFQVMCIEIPDSLQIKEIALKDLPSNWRKGIGADELQSYGSSWLKEGKEAICKVPSAIIPFEKNVLINPEHPDFSKIKLVDSFSLDIDERFIMN